MDGFFLFFMLLLMPMHDDDGLVFFFFLFSCSVFESCRFSCFFVGFSFYLPCPQFWCCLDKRLFEKIMEMPLLQTALLNFRLSSLLRLLLPPFPSPLFLPALSSIALERRDNLEDHDDDKIMENCCFPMRT